jgi:hypothetical protein
MMARSLCASFCQRLQRQVGGLGHIPGYSLPTGSDRGYALVRMLITVNLPQWPQHCFIPAGWAFLKKFRNQIRFFQIRAEGAFLRELQKFINRCIGWPPGHFRGITILGPISPFSCKFFLTLAFIEALTAMGT